MVAHAGWEREPDRPGRAEVAFAIADAMQHNGLGTILLGQLIEAADQAGVAVLSAEVLPQNQHMLHVFRDSGIPVTTRTLPGVVLVELPTSRSPATLELRTPRAASNKRSEKACRQPESLSLCWPRWRPRLLSVTVLGSLGRDPLRGWWRVPPSPACEVASYRSWSESSWAISRIRVGMARQSWRTVGGWMGSSTAAVGRWLRPAVLGANDGIVSTASLVIGVAAAAASRNAVLLAGVAGLVGGATSMAAGEYVSVSSQRDAERADSSRDWPPTRSPSWPS